MFKILFFCLGTSLALITHTYAITANEVIERGRATVGVESALNDLVTLKYVGTLSSADPDMLSGTLAIIARKPSSQRFELRVDDIVETTIVNGDKGCMIRSNLNAEASQMRDLLGAELERVVHSTRQLFSFYQPDFKNGEQVSFEGMETRQGQRVYKLVYRYPSGLETIRYFSIEDDTLVATVTDNGVASVGVGSQRIGGIKFPERIEYYEGGRKLYTIALNRIEVNKPLAAGIFDVPEGELQ